MAEDLTKPYLNYNHLVRRPPKAQPNPVNSQPEEECVNCVKKCTKPVIATSWIEYGCWCGPNLAPAVKKDVEKDIPASRSGYDAFLKEKGLPQPYDPVDRCCMVHDLDLGRARQKDPKAGFSTGSVEVAGINARLAACFAAMKYHPKTGLWGRAFATYATPVFGGLAAWNLGGAYGNALTNSGASAATGADAGFGDVGAGSAGSGALYAFGA